jgi:hypothetical protein
VTYRPIARQRPGKHILTEAYALNNMTSIANQWISKNVFSAMDSLCFLFCLCRKLIKGKRRSFERSCRELGRVLETAVEGDWEGMARKEFDCAKKASHVIRSYSETVMNPLQGYDL